MFFPCQLAWEVFISSITGTYSDSLSWPQNTTAALSKTVPSRYHLLHLVISHKWVLIYSNFLTEPLALRRQAFGINHDWIFKKLEVKIAFYCNLKVLDLEKRLKKFA